MTGDVDFLVEDAGEFYRLECPLCFQGVLAVINARTIPRLLIAAARHIGKYHPTVVDDGWPAHSLD